MLHAQYNAALNVKRFQIAVVERFVMSRPETSSSSDTKMPIDLSVGETKIADPSADAGVTLDAVPDQSNTNDQRVDDVSGGTIIEDPSAASAVQVHSRGVIEPAGDRKSSHTIDEQAVTLIQPDQKVLDASQDASRADHEIPSIMATMVEQARAAQEVQSGVTVSALPINVPSRSAAEKQSFDGDTRVGGIRPSPPKREGMSSGADRYLLLDNFAHGGLGNIWKAEDKAIRREVAFKELLPKALRNKAVVERFIEEAQITGQLEHPGIVPIYDIGYQENGAPFYSMKLVRGSNLEKAIESMHALTRNSSERNLAFTRLLRQFISVCQAVGFAHEKGVLHRDLKPLNIMIGEFGETLVLDWGLAKLVDIIGEQTISSDRADVNAPDDDVLASDATADRETVIAPGPEHQTGETLVESAVTGTNATGPAVTSRAVPTGSVQNSQPAGSIAAKSQTANKTSATLPGSHKTQNSSTVAGTGQRQVSADARSAGSETLMGQVMGTPAYMPPEQAQGLINELDARSDIYSLGGILYKILTNLQPVGRGKIVEVMQAVIAGKVKPPRTIDATIPMPLEAICLKALSKVKTDRYSKALDLASDVEAFLADEPVSVYAEPWTDRAWRWIKRHRTFVFSSSAATVVLFVSISGWSWIEGARIERLRGAAASKTADARIAIEAADFTKANSLLTVALGQVQAESKLASVRANIQNQIDDVARLQQAAEHERVAVVRLKAEQRLDEAQQEINENQDFPQAKVLLTEIVAVIASESKLTDLRQRAQSQLDLVNRALTQRSAVAAAQAQLGRFDTAVEQTRVFGGNLSGEDSIDDLREARKHGLGALDLFEFDVDHPDQLDARLKLLGEPATVKWRTGVFELLVTIAQAEINLAMKDKADDVRVAAERSLQYVDRAERLGLTSQPAMMLRAELHNLLGQDDQAKLASAKAETIAPQSRLDHFLLGERSRLSRKYDEAVSHFQNALRVDPDDFWSLNMIGLCHYQAGRPAAASAGYTASISRRPELIWPYIVRGLVFGDLKQFDNSQRDFDKALTLDPRSYHVFLNRGVVAVMQKKFAAAQSDFERAAQLKPDQAAPYINIAEVGLQQGAEFAASNDAATNLRASAEYEKALVALTKATEISPQQATIYFFRGRIQVALNAEAAALADFERATKLEPSPRRRARCSREIGRIHQRANRLAPALLAYDNSLEEDSSDDIVLRLRAETLLALGRHQDAVRDFTAYLEKVGPVGDVYRARGLANASLKRYREAINDYTMSLQYEPSPNMLTRRGWAYLLNATNLAKEDFADAIQQNPQDPDPYQGLANALVTLGDYSGAVTQLEKSEPLALRTAAQIGPRAWPLLFNPATIYAQAVAKVRDDAKRTTAERDELATKFTVEAVKLLTAAHKLAGQKSQAIFAENLRTDTALDPIRQRTEFLEALQTLDPESAK